MNSLFYVTGHIGMKFGKNVNRCALLNLTRRILKFSLGCFWPQTAILALFWRVSAVTGLHVTLLRFFDLAKPSVIRARASGMPTANWLFVWLTRLTVSTVEVPKTLTSGLQWQSYRFTYVMCFRLAVWIPSYSGRSNGVPFLWRFFVRLTVLPLQFLEVNFDDVANTVARCYSPLTANYNFHCQTPLENAKFDLFGSCRMPIGKSVCE